MPYLLDTNVVSDLIRFPRGRAAARLAEVGLDRVQTSILVAAELRFGVAKRASPSLGSQVDAVLSAMGVAPFEAPADTIYGEVRAAVERNGFSVGGVDLLIAAHALALNCTLVTDNEREFSRVPGLVVVNWLRA